VDLVLAGRRRTDSAPIAAEPGLRLAGAVPDAELPRLYSNAVAFLYPSLYEGFGLPVLEAMQCGAAVITSRDAAIGEVCRDAAVVLDAADARAWTNAMAMAAKNPEWRARQAELGMRRAAAFSWRRTAKLTREVYDEAAARFAGNA
jgi:glycosyltransferase involved in cell wall biosynthesis